MRRPAKLLFSRLFDYAGMFPPAALTVEESLAEFERLGGSFVLNRFCCPAGALGRLGSRPMAVSVIGSPSKDLEGWRSAREEDAKAMTANGDDLELAAYEVRSPSRGLAQAEIRDLVGFSSVDVFVELTLDEELEDDVADAAEIPWLKLKVRTGDIPPAPDLLARFIAQCLSLEMPFKLTAGLHHAITKLEPALEYGFVNVLAATALAYAEELPPETIGRVLQETDPAAFAVTDEFLRWNGLTASTASIEEARELFLSIGSCSVAEPLEELGRLGWI